MTSPEDALGQARQAAEALREAGTYPAAPPPDTGPTPAEARLDLLQWAFIEPPPTVLRSTRSHGAPITAGKRLLRRLLGQYLGALTANQTRFNLALLAELGRMDERLASLEIMVRQAPSREEHDR